MAQQSKRITLKLHNFRTSYCYVYTQPVGEDGEAQKFGTHLIFAENHPEAAQIMGAINEVGQSFFKEEWAQALASIKGKDKLCLHRGDVSKAGQEPYRGMLYLTANNNTRPTLVDQNAVQTTAKEQLFYSGCYVDPIVTIYAYPAGKKYAAGLGCELNGLQFRAHGDRLSGGRVAATSEFAPIDGASADGAAPSATAGLV